MKNKAGLIFADKIAKLIDVKTIVTFAIISVFVVLALRERISADNVILIVSNIITFFFAKNTKGGNDSGN